MFSPQDLSLKNRAQSLYIKGLNRIAMASNLQAMASNLIASQVFVPTEIHRRLLPNTADRETCSIHHTLASPRYQGFSVRVADERRRPSSRGPIR